MPDQQDSKHIILQKIWSRVSRGIGFTLAIYFFLTTIFTWLDDAGAFGLMSTEGIAIFTFPYWFIVPRWFIEFWIFFYFAHGNEVLSLSSIAVIWIMGIAMVAILVVVGIMVTRKLRSGTPFSLRKLPWLRIALCAWILNGLVFVPQATSVIDWHLPTTDLSRQIEQKQFGPLFSFVQYLNRYQGVIRYNVTREKGNGLLIQQTHLPAEEQRHVKLYEIEFSTPDKNITVSKVQSTFPFEHNPGYEKMEDGITCLSSIRDHAGLLFSERNICQELQFNGVTIFQEKRYGVHVKRVIHDEKNNILLIHFSPYFSDSEHVSMVTLP